MHRALDVGTKNGERRLELVAGVSSEAAERGEGALETRDHCVQSRREARELIAAGCDGEATVEAAAVGDRFDLVDQLVDGAEGTARHEVGHA